MAEANQTVEEYLNDFLRDDENAKDNPMTGNRAAENSLMRLCDFMKTNSRSINDDVRTRTVATIQKMNLRPYRSYCREHLLDIGIENI